MPNFSKLNIYRWLYKKKNFISLKNNFRLKIMAGLVSANKNTSILDIGCHDGSFLSLFAKQTKNLWGIETSLACLKECRKKGLKTINFFFDSVAKIPLKEKFDYIVAGEIIEHIYDTDFFLQEIHRLLKNDGFLILTTPNLCSLGRRLFTFLGKSPFIENSVRENGSCGHIRYFTKNSLISLLEKNKFTVLFFRSDIVNFDIKGQRKSALLAKFFPTIGQSLIVKCYKTTK